MHMQEGWQSRKSNDEKIDEQAEKARPTIENENKTHFSLWVLVSDVQDALLFLTLLINMKHNLG